MGHGNIGLCPPVTEQEQAAETRISGEKENMSSAMVDKVAYLRDKIGRGEYKLDLIAIAAAMLAADKRQISDSQALSKC